MKLHCKLGRGGVVVRNTKEKTCKKESGQHPCNIILQHSFLQREMRPQMLCLLSQGCVERSSSTDRRPSTAWGSFPTHTLSNTRGNTDRGFVYLKDCRRIQSHKNIKIIHASAQHLVSETLNKQKKSSGQCSLILENRKNSSESLNVSNKYRLSIQNFFKWVCHEQPFVDFEIPNLWISEGRFCSEYLRVEQQRLAIGPWKSAAAFRASDLMS